MVLVSAERNGVVDKHVATSIVAVLFRGGTLSDGGIIWEFTYCAAITEVGLLNEGDVYVILMYEVIEFRVLR